MTRMVGIGFIGTGGVASLHADALGDLPDARLIGVWSRTPRNVERFARARSCRAYGSVDALLDDPAIDAVFVLSTSAHHADHAIKALAAGKHVLVEKPVGISLAELDAVGLAAAAADRILMPSHNYIYAADAVRLKKHLDDGRLGRPQSFWMLCNQRQTQAMGFDGSVMQEMMIHLIYSSLYYFGRPERLVAVSSNVYFETGADDQIGVTLAYDDGRIGHLWASWATEDMSRDPWTATIKVMGSKGAGVVAWDNIKNNDEPQPGWDDAAYWDSFLNVQRFFVDQVIGRGAAPLSGLAEARDSALILRAIERSIADGLWVAPFEEK